MNKQATFKFRNNTYTVRQNESIKRVDGPDYHCKIDLQSGYTERWGRTKATEDDPVMAPFPEIFDFEIATACSGIPQVGSCKFCYKSNTSKGFETTSAEVDIALEHLSFWTDNGWISPLGQIAYGIGNANNENLIPIFELTRYKYGIVPNTTCNGAYLTDELIREWGRLLGAVAISNYGEICFDAVEKFTRLTNLKVNIHQIVSEENYDQCMQLLHQRKTDPRLSKLNAIVFLMLKPKGRGRSIAPLTNFNKYKALIDEAINSDLMWGADSCSAPTVMKALSNRSDAQQIYESIDPCEAFLFSAYANHKGECWPCSFSENELGWWNPPKLTEITNFIEEVWDAPRTSIWRNILLNSTTHPECKICQIKSHCRTCPIYNLNLCRV